MPAVATEEPRPCPRRALRAKTKATPFELNTAPDPPLPSQATRVSAEHFAFFLDKRWCQNRRIAWQTPSTPPLGRRRRPRLGRHCRRPRHTATIGNRHAVEQLERCVLSPSIRLPCTCRTARVGEWARSYHLDDQRRLCCALPCATCRCPYNSACGRLIDVSRSLSDDTRSSHYCSRCYERYERY